MTNEKSYHSLKEQFTFIKRDSLKGKENLFLIGTHLDMDDKVQVNPIEPPLYAKEICAQFIEVSCRDNTNIQILFETVASMIKEKEESWAERKSF